MRILLALCFAVAAASCLFAADKDGSALGLPPEFKFDNLVRITPRPTRLKPSVQTACLPANAKFDHGNLVPQPAVAHVYVSPDAIEAMFKHDATPFPIGSVVLKQKLEAANPGKVILYTGMLKREPGFNPDCGDWEFFTLSGDAHTVTSRGRLKSCIACHQDYARSDFVTKEYPLER